jgi:hypothetical protein
MNRWSIWAIGTLVLLLQGALEGTSSEAAFAAAAEENTQSGSVQDRGVPFQPLSPSGPVPIPYPNVAPPPLAPELATISAMIAEGKPTSAILQAWKAHVTRRVQSRQPFQVDQTINQVIAQAETQVKVMAEGLKAKIRAQEKLNAIGDDAQLANVDLQNAIQKQQQILQMMSNISKMMHDTAMAVIRKTGG